MKKFTLSICIILFISLVAFAWLSKTGRLKRFTHLHTTAIAVHNKPDKATIKELQDKANEAALFIKKNNYNDHICFLVDMGLASGKKRFFVYDLRNDSILMRGLVAHGSCDAGFQSSPIFSNTNNSGCTALGKYKIGNAYSGTFGLAYKLYGLDSTNRNAFIRNIVLHAYSCVPEQETDFICNSRGCPMVAPGFLQQLKPIINASAKPVLLWIYE